MSEERRSFPWQTVRYVAACGFLLALGAAATGGIFTWPRVSQSGPATEVRTPAVAGAVAANTKVTSTSTTPSRSNDPARALAEAKLLDLAADALAAGDEAKTLALLDTYLTEHPSGLLARNERALRLQLLMSKQRRAEALALLDALELRADEVRLFAIRAELREGVGRCAEAVPDFEAVLASTPIEKSLGERALWGRASCRLTLGDGELARADLRQYLALYPEGARAPDAKRLLGP